MKWLKRKDKTKNSPTKARLVRSADLHHSPRKAHGRNARNEMNHLMTKARRRLTVAGLAFTIATVAVAFRTAELTMANPAPPYITPNIITSIEAQNQRANITDRNGNLLATSVSAPSLYADPSQILDPTRTTDLLLGIFPNLDRNLMIERLSSQRRFAWIERQISPYEQQAVLSLGLAGIDFQNEPRRIYPQNELTSHIVGYTDIDQNGIAGLELSSNHRLATNDDNLNLALDIRIQESLHNALANAMESYSAIAANGLVMDVNTGEIIAMVSLPDYNPLSRYPTGATELFNRNIQGVYEMGSTFKIFNTAMVLDRTDLTVNDGFDITDPIQLGRYRIEDFHPEEGVWNIAQIFEFSSNIGSIHMVRHAGREMQRDFLTSLGLTSPLHIELPGGGSPLIPNPWSTVSMTTIAYGHGIAVTPIQLTSAVSSIVNGGHLIQPTIFAVDTDSYQRGPQIISEETSATMRSIMRQSVREGTGQFSDVEGYIVGGKTGTADKASGSGYDESRLISSYIGVFPMNNPQYAVLAMLDEPKATEETYGYATGGWVAAPAVGRVIEDIASIYGILPQDENSPEIATILDLNLDDTPNEIELDAYLTIEETRQERREAIVSN